MSWSSTSRSWRIVLTDDDPRIVTLVASILRSAGHVVFAAYNGLAACELATQLPYIQLLITNTRISNVAAPELIRRVRAEKPCLAILHIGDPLPDADGEFGDVPTLREPFTAGQLLAAVRMLIETPSEEDISSGSPDGDPRGHKG